MKNEDTVDVVRAESNEMPVRNKRATNGATNEDQPLAHERAAKHEKLDKNKRAPKPGKPLSTERAQDNDNPASEERAIQDEEPASEERAILEEPPVTSERARDAEKTVSTERPLGALVVLRDQIQKLRIAEGNRAGAYDKLEDDRRATVHRAYEKRLLLLEHETEADVAEEVKQHPAWSWLERIRGVGPTSAALVLGEIDIERCNTISALWKFAGYAVTDGKRDRLTKGQKRPYNAKLKVYVWRLIDLQVKHRGPYRVAYDNAKNRYLTTKTDWTKGHVEQAARRVAAKLFLSHLWQVWREAEGLPISEPWVIRYGGEGHDLIGPWAYTEKDPK